MAKTYGYARVSTVVQELEVQLNELKKFGVPDQYIYSEKTTGAKMEKRPVFQELLDKLENGDTLVVVKLDRFARSVIDGIRIIKMLFERGVSVHIVNMGKIENTPSGRLLMNVMLSFAEFERDLIQERTTAGKELAKQREDFRDGRPPTFGRRQKLHAVELLKTYTYREVEQLTGMSRATLYRAQVKYGGLTPCDTTTDKANQLL